MTGWRQLYYDDAQSLAAKYDLVNRYDIRGAAIWALGYDGRRPELYAVLKDKFITDTVPPVITASAVSAAAFSPNGDGRNETVTMHVTATGFIRYGWRVEPFFDGAAGSPVLEGAADGSDASFTWDARAASGAGVADGPYRVTIWTADASDNRAAASAVVTVDRELPTLASSATPITISPNGDRRFDTTNLAMTASEPVTGRARVMDRQRSHRPDVEVRQRARRRPGSGTAPTTRARWSRTGSTASGSMGSTPPGTARWSCSRSWSIGRSATSPGRSGPSRPVPTRPTGCPLRLIRAATVSVSIYQGKTLVRRVWIDKPMEHGTWTWKWNGRNGHAELVEPGVYTASVTTTTAVGVSHLTRTVTVKAP